MPGDPEGYLAPCQTLELLLRSILAGQQLLPAGSCDLSRPRSVQRRRHSHVRVYKR